MRKVRDIQTLPGRCIELAPEERELLETGAKLHDIGKIGIPEEIPNKPGKLTDTEFDIIKTHPVIGEQILRPWTS